MKESRDWSEVLSDRLRDVQMEPSEGLWSRIEEASEVRGRRSWLRRSLVAVAATVVLFFAVDALYFSGELHGSRSYSWQVEGAKLGRPIEWIIADDSVELIGSVASVPKESVACEVVEEIKELNPNQLEVEPLEQELEPTQEQEAGSESEQESEPRDREQSEDVTTYENSYLAYDSRGGSRMRDLPTVVALNVGGALSGSSHIGDLAYRPTQLTSDLVSSQDYSTLQFINGYDGSEIDHRVPFSVALGAGHNLTERLRVVGALCYTALLSDVALPYDDVVQKLELLGVPIRVDYDIWVADRFSLYGGLGGSVEYLLAAKVGDIKIDERRWHYSAVAAVGVEYKLIDWVGLYFEPELAYYFTKTKLRTIRNDMPVNFSMRFGLRFAF